MLRIEPAGLHDMAGAYRTCLLAGDAGDDASGLYRDPDLLGHIYVGPYLAHGGGTQLLPVDESGSAGYLLSTDDTARFEDWAERAWWPPLRARYALRDDDTPDAELIRHIHAPPRTPPGLARDYPAHLHIDLQERARGAGLGRLLIERLISELASRGVPAVHLGVDAGNTNAIGFYKHLGFHEVDPRPDELIMGMRIP